MLSHGCPFGITDDLHPRQQWTRRPRRVLGDAGLEQPRFKRGRTRRPAALDGQLGLSATSPSARVGTSPMTGSAATARRPADRTRRGTSAVRSRTGLMTRRRRRRAATVDDHRLDIRLGRGFNAGSVAVGACGRAVGMLNDPHAVANRAERTVDVNAVDPGAGLYAARTEHNSKCRQNEFDVLVHNTPTFPFTER